MGVGGFIRYEAGGVVGEKIKIEDDGVGDGRVGGSGLVTVVEVELVEKNESFEKLKAEAEKCLLQSEKLSIEREEFESEVYAKFVNVLNSKKAKLRELRDRLSKQTVAGKQPQEVEVSSDGTEPYHSGSESSQNTDEKSDDF